MVITSEFVLLYRLSEPPIVIPYLRVRARQASGNPSFSAPLIIRHCIRVEIRSLLLRFLVGIPVHEMAVFAGFIKMIARFEQGVGILLVNGGYRLHGDIVEFSDV